MQVKSCYQLTLLISLPYESLIILLTYTVLQDDYLGSTVGARKSYMAHLRRKKFLMEHPIMGLRILGGNFFFF